MLQVSDLHQLARKKGSQDLMKRCIASCHVVTSHGCADPEKESSSGTGSTEVPAQKISCFQTENLAACKKVSWRTTCRSPKRTL